MTEKITVPVDDRTLLKKRILLVEDNPNDEWLTLRALRRSNIMNEVVVARDGQEALDYLFAEGKYARRDVENLPVVVLLDLKLPKIDGLEVLRLIRTDPRTRHLPVVVLTGSKDEQDLIEVYDLGANSFICKPIDFENFSAAVGHLGMYWVLFNELPAQTTAPKELAT